jgi:tRNA(fMet)-specific endonuclease VapC
MDRFALNLLLSELLLALMIFKIAAIALANNLTLVTHNTREFSRVAGLQIEDWEAD